MGAIAGFFFLTALLLVLDDIQRVGTFWSVQHRHEVLDINRFAAHVADQIEPFVVDAADRLVGSFAGEQRHLVPIVAAGGEYVIPPHVVVGIGNGDLDTGHKELDDFVKKMRSNTVATLRKLPGPKVD